MGSHGALASAFSTLSDDSLEFLGLSG